LEAEKRVGKAAIAHIRAICENLKETDSGVHRFVRADAT
jgi:hypothetical protein